MKCATLVAALLASAGLCAVTAAQDTTKPPPKDSMRVAIPGCTKDQIFTAIRRTEEQPGSSDIPEGMHLRMNGPKKMMTDIKAREGTVIVLTGLMKKGQQRPDGVSIGGGIRISPAAPPNSGRPVPPAPSQAYIDVENWRPGVGECPGR